MNSARLAAQSRWMKRQSPRPSSTRQAPMAAACSTSDSAVTGAAGRAGA